MPAKKGNKYAKGNKGGGRPSAFKDEYIKVAYQMALLGATDEEMASAFDVTEATINNWKKEHQEFFLALKNGKTIADAKVADRLYQRAMGYEHAEDKIFQFQGEPVIVPTIRYYPPDPTSAIFWLKNRQPSKWRDKQEHEHTGPDGKELFPVDNLSAEERSKFLKLLDNIGDG